MNNVEVYTDGSCLGNPGPGGYAAIVIGDCSKRIVAGSDPRTTNNLMELTAVLEGLKTVQSASSITIHTDSQLVIGWLQSGWKRNDTACAILLAEIEQLISEKDHAVSFVKVKGHSRHTFNEECDRVARMYATLIKEQFNPIELAHNNGLNLDMNGTPEKGEKILQVSTCPQNSEYVPFIRIAGKWLARIGFHTGNKVKISFHFQRIVIESVQSIQNEATRTSNRCSESDVHPQTVDPT